jgi:hypothetical protein
MQCYWDIPRYFHHHFKSKSQLAKIIYWDNSIKQCDVFRKWVNVENDKQLISILSYRIHWYKFFADEKYGRFFLEANPVILNIPPEEYFNLGLDDLVFPATLDTCDDEFKLNIASFSAIEIAIP